MVFGPHILLVPILGLEGGFCDLLGSNHVLISTVWSFVDEFFSLVL